MNYSPDWPVVDFLIIGAQKAGTSTLFELLNNHPSICGSRHKEPGFFIGQNQMDLASYHALFTKKKGQLAFEATTSYTAYPHHRITAYEEILKYNSEMKLIYLIRNPIERIVSAHRFSYKRGKNSKRNINDNLRANNYIIDLSRYYFQIAPYIERFGKNKVLIIFSGDLSSNPSTVLDHIAEFLKIDPFPSKNLGLKLNSKDGIQPPNSLRRLLYPTYSFVKRLYPNAQFRWIKKLLKPIFERKLPAADLEISTENKAMLRTILLPEIEGIEQLTGRDLTHWKKSLLS